MIVIRTPTWGKHQRPRRIDTSDEPTRAATQSACAPTAYALCGIME